MALSSFILQTIFFQALLAILSGSEPSTYKAAILEHEFRPYTSSPLETMLANVQDYTDAATKAKQMGADMLVFPECGITGWDYPNDVNEELYEDLYIYLPNKAIGRWAPCETPQQFKSDRNNTQVFERLSCAARNNSLVIVAHLQTKEPCTVSEEPSCPARGFFKFSTNVVFNREGTIVARYHKRHLFGEESLLNPAPKNEFQIVDFGFVKFGTLICFDGMFADPMIDYITKAGIRNFIFTTAWPDYLPYLTSVQLFSGIARGLGVNFIGSNAYVPKDGRLGSGIYSSSKGTLNETNDLSFPGRLLIAELPETPLPVSEAKFDCSFNPTNFALPVDLTNVLYSSVVMTTQPSSAPTETLHKYDYTSLSNFSSTFLISKEGNVSLCEADLCCHVDYAFDQMPSGDLYILAIRNGVHPFKPTMGYFTYMQVCSILRCTTNDIETCGRVTEGVTSVKFSRLLLTGGFATTTLFPSIISTDLQSFPDSEWEFTKGPCSGEQSQFQQAGQVALVTGASKPILVASIYGRVYDRD